MQWNGDKFKARAKELNVQIQDIAKQLDITRQTVNSWITGQIPKGNHLLNISKILHVNPDYFFDEEETAVFVPILHRARRGAKVTPQTQESAQKMASEYEIFFKNHTQVDLIPLSRTNNNQENALELSKKLRKYLDVNRDIPIDYKNTFDLIRNLNIYLIFRNFPNEIKSYAFYTKISNHRVVFINTATNILDLIFPLLHEIVHAVRDENVPYDKKEEDFCDAVAGYVQFPSEYINEIYQRIKNKPKAQQIIILKSYSEKYGHAMYGVVKSIKEIDPQFNLEVGGADTNLKSQFGSIGDVIINGKSVSEYIQWLFVLSPHFMDLILNQIESMTPRKLAEYLDLNNVWDANEVRKELLRRWSAVE
jgi:transcriptional regulator with XRE-family HTH domain